VNAYFWSSFISNIFIMNSNVTSTTSPLVILAAIIVILAGMMYASSIVSPFLLAPYGEWIYTPEYGYAWRPYIDYYEDFRPYATRGNWVYTDLGWTWVSDYRWGWATFHYGRWFYDDYFGWMWLPGYEWAPAWVTWGVYNDYWAWAPMGPNIHVNINFGWHAPGFWWTMVPRRHFCSHNWYSHIYHRPVQINNITIINNVYYGKRENHYNQQWYNGPRVTEVEKHARTKVKKRTIIDAEKPGRTAMRDNSVPVYRPEVTKQETRSKPANYRTVEKRRSDTRTTENSQIRSRTTENNRVSPRTNEKSRVSPRTRPAAERKTETTTKRYEQPKVAPKPSSKPPAVRKNRYEKPKVSPRPSNQTSGKRNTTGVKTRNSQRSAPARVESSRKTGNQTYTRHSTSTRKTSSSPAVNRSHKTNPKPAAKKPAPSRTISHQTRSK
jgi:hypothetical protein